MQLIGMLDSPFVRRVAITMQMLGIEYERRPLSVLSTYEEFRTVNPLVKVPTLVCDDGEMLIDSSLIINHLESIAGRSLMPEGIDNERRALQLIGVALVAMEKVAQQHYELTMRPEEYLYKPWFDRLVQQLGEALDWLERSVSGLEDERWLFSGEITQADISTAVAWRFAAHMVSDVADSANYPELRAFSRRAEALPEFLACPLE